ncbi:hypothetical protein HLB23_14180 [Nocardia uniformis]|uniref:Uncharacterized protein n=1 Tax=Nocardia uniformis TaxID=53432 RepID=A0A849C5A7_9NOCA|nr:hypothetical protein [Nocardia uniformis]NNH70997.1 hypothetical protein [Nocardia uniformis]
MSTNSLCADFGGDFAHTGFVIDGGRRYPRPLGPEDRGWRAGLAADD